MASKTDAKRSKAVQLQHATLSWCLTKPCKRTSIFKNQEKIFKRMTCSTIRYKIITESVWLKENSLDNTVFCFGNLILGKYYFRLITLKVRHWSNWLANQYSSCMVWDPFLEGEEMSLLFHSDIVNFLLKTNKGEQKV